MSSLTSLPLYLFARVSHLIVIFIVVNVIHHHLIHLRQCL